MQGEILNGLLCLGAGRRPRLTVLCRLVVWPLSPAVPPVGTRSLLLLSLSRHALPTAPTHTPQEIPRVNFLPTLTSFSRFPPTLLQSCITWAHRQSPPLDLFQRPTLMVMMFRSIFHPPYLLPRDSSLLPIFLLCDSLLPHSLGYSTPSNLDSRHTIITTTITTNTTTTTTTSTPITKYSQIHHSSIHRPIFINHNHPVSPIGRTFSIPWPLRLPLRNFTTASLCIPLMVSHRRTSLFHNTCPMVLPKQYPLVNIPTRTPMVRNAPRNRLRTSSTKHGTRIRRPFRLAHTMTTMSHMFRHKPMAFVRPAKEGISTENRLSTKKLIFSQLLQAQTELTRSLFPMSSTWIFVTLCQLEPTATPSPISLPSPVGPPSSPTCLSPLR